MKLLDMFPQEKRDLIIKEGSLDLLVSAFLSISRNLIKRGEDIDQLREELRLFKDKEEQPESAKDDRTVSMPVSTHNYSFNK